MSSWTRGLLEDMVGILTWWGSGRRRGEGERELALLPPPDLELEFHPTPRLLHSSTEPQHLWLPTSTPMAARYEFDQKPAPANQPSPIIHPEPTPQSSVPNQLDPSPPTLPSASNPSTAPIQAYFKLDFDHFSYYLQTLSVTIGRRTQVSQMSTPNDLLCHFCRVDVASVPARSAHLSRRR